MNDSVKARMGIVYNVFEATILAIMVFISQWCIRTIIDHGNTLASMNTEITATDKRVDRIETRGSSGLESHIKEADSRAKSTDMRIDKLESAVLALQSAPGELKAISVRLDGLREGQARIEKMFEEHVKSNGSKP